MTPRTNRSRMEKNSSSMDDCTLNAAPNYTEAGRYNVYYQITYTYWNTDIVENGVATVWLYDTNNVPPTQNPQPDPGQPSPQPQGGNPYHSHNFSLLESVAPLALPSAMTATCVNCGTSNLTDYTVALGHSWDNGTTITKATCTGERVTEYRCVRYDRRRIEGETANGHVPGPIATCTELQLCTNCSAVLQAALGHNHVSTVTAPTCTEMEYATSMCLRCGESNRSDYTKPCPAQLPDGCDCGGLYGWWLYHVHLSVL